MIKKTVNANRIILRLILMIQNITTTKEPTSALGKVVRKNKFLNNRCNFHKIYVYLYEMSNRYTYFIVQRRD